MEYVKAVERAERDVGLVFAPPEAQPYAIGGRLLRPPQRGALSLGKEWRSSYPWQVLRVAVHTYLSLATNVSGPHFSWSESRDRMVLTALGKRLLLCLDLYKQEQKMFENGMRDSLRSATFVESAHFRFFQDLLAQRAEAIKGTQKDLYLEQHLFVRDDVVRLQGGLDETIGLLRGSEAKKHNKRLYDESYKTSLSLQHYLDDLRSAHASLEAFAFEICLDTSKGNELAAHQEAKRARYQLASEFPENFLQALKQASAFIAYLKKVGSVEIKGHLIKLSATTWGEPRCTVILMGPEVRQLLVGRATSHSQLSLIWADFILGPWGVLEGHWGRSMQAPGIQLLPDGEWSRLKRNANAWKALHGFVDEVFVKELPFMRLGLPERRRAWSKGGNPGKA